MAAKVVLALILMVSLIVWAIIGLLIWIPILIRAVAMLSLMVVHAAFVRQSPEHLRGYLDAASSFYFNGFRFAYNAVYGSTGADEPRPFRIVRFICECTYTLLFWFVSLLASHPSQVQPVLHSISSAFAPAFDSVSRLITAFAQLSWWMQISVVVATLLVAILIAIQIDDYMTTQKAKKTHEP
jgi:hypothetical protein